MSISRSNLRFFLSLDGLGGPITSSPAGDLFPDVRGVEAEKGITDYACFYFVNLDADPDGFRVPHLWFMSREGKSTVTVGFDPAGKNHDAQRIASRFDAPTGVRFDAPTTEITPFWLPDDPYHENDRVALWVRRVVPKGAPIGSEGFTLKFRGESY